MTNKQFIYQDNILREYVKKPDFDDYRRYQWEALLMFQIALSEWEQKASQSALTLPVINPPSDWNNGDVKEYLIDFAIIEQGDARNPELKNRVAIPIVVKKEEESQEQLWEHAIQEAMEYARSRFPMTDSHWDVDYKDYLRTNYTITRK